MVINVARLNIICENKFYVATSLYVLISFGLGLVYVCFASLASLRE
jgi:hypothetical protein